MWASAKWHTIHRLLSLLGIFVLGTGAFGQVSVVTDLKIPFRLSVDAGNLYFINVTPNTNYGDVETAPANGGAAIPLISGDFSDLLIANLSLYASSKNGDILSRSLITGSTQSLVSQGHDGRLIGSLGFDLYYINGSSSIDKTSILTQQTTTVVPGVWARDGALDGTGVYFDNYASNSIEKYDFSTQTVSHFADAQPGGNDKVRVDSQNAYIKLAGGGVQVLPKSGGTPIPLVNGNVGFSPYPPDSSSGYLVDHGYIYYSLGDALKRTSIQDGATIRLATIAPNSVTGIASDGKSIFYGVANGTAGNGTIERIQIPPPTQKVVLAFDDPAPYKIIEKHKPFTTKTEFVWTNGSTEKIDPGSVFREQVTDRIRSIFIQSGINNIDIVDASPTSSATTVYFGSYGTAGDLFGISSRVDAFNAHSDDHAIVFAQRDPANGSNFDIEQTAKTAAHEIGHTLGLIHVPSLTNDDPETMAQGAVTRGILPRFHNSVRQSPDSQKVLTHNPKYHLLRYVDGLSDDTLQAEGIHPGTWDTPKSLLHVLFHLIPTDQQDRTLYDVNILSSIGSADANLDPDETSTIAHFDQIKISTLSSLVFDDIPGDAIQLIAASTADRADSLDISIAVGDPSLESNLYVPIMAGTTEAQLLMQSPSGNGYTILAQSTISITVPEPNALMYMLPVAVFWRSRRK
jgi:hypothetical protein